MTYNNINLHPCCTIFSERTPPESKKNSAPPVLILRTLENSAAGESKMKAFLHLRIVICRRTVNRVTAEKNGRGDSSNYCDVSVRRFIAHRA